MAENDRAAILERKLSAIFQPESAIQAKQLHDTYGTESHERETDRVRLAILKLSGNTLDGMRRYLEIAKQDYRDVLAWAEYPNQTKAGPALETPDRQSLIERDAAQYREWLNS
ncbi:MAG TPA: hypothetical protein VIT83_06180 [Gammaproteobacteria bacterium]